MSKKDNNFGNAMYDMFGIGTDNTETKDAPVDDLLTTPTTTTTAYSVTASTYLAPDTVMEGTLRTKSDVEIAGTFTGDIFSEGDVLLHTSVTGNVSARNMTLMSCNLNGECTVSQVANINAGSSVTGNITAKDVNCSGAISGDMSATGSVNLSSSARVKGNIVAKALSVEPGAAIEGKLTIAK